MDANGKVWVPAAVRSGRSTWRMGLGALAACAALAAAAAPAAHASRVEITDHGTHRVLHYTADPGDADDVGFAAPTGQTIVSVTGANVSVGAGCTLLGPGTDYAICDKTGLTGVDVDLGDRDDRLTVASDLGVPFVVDGGDGADRLDVAGNGSQIDGGDGDDTIDADDPTGTGADDIHGGAGHDTVFYNNRRADLSISLDDVADDGSAGEGDDVHSDVEEVYAGTGDDTLTGSSGDDSLHGGGGTDTLTGLGGDDTLDGWGWEHCDDDVLSGGPGDDTLVLNGRVQADGGADDDRFEPGVGTCAGTDVHGGSGHDRATVDGHSYSYDGTESYSLDDVANDGWSGAEDYHSDIEDLTTTSNGSTILIGSPGPNVLTGGSGDDLLQGGDGADTLIGGAGTDVADYSDHTGPVTLTLDGAADDGAPGEGDRIAADVEDLRGGSGDDTLTGDAQNNVFDGGPGADVIVGGDGFDAVDYSYRSAPVRVDLDGSPGDDGQAGEGDTVGADVEGVFGGDGGDTLTGNRGEGFLDGGPGNDTLTDPGGGDGLFGDGGDDDIDSTNGAQDDVSCGDGADQLWRDAIDRIDDGDCEKVATGPRGATPSTPTRHPTLPHLPGVVLPRPPLTPVPVKPIDRVAPTAHVTVLKGARLKTLLARGLDVNVFCDENCTIAGRLIARSATARTLRHHGVATGATLAAGRLAKLAGGRVRLRVTATGRHALAHLRTASLQLVLTVTDHAGNHRRVKRSLTLRR